MILSKLFSTVKFISHSVLRGKGGTAAVLQTLLTRILILAVNVLTGIITARFLGPTGRGEQAAMGLWPQFIAFTLTLGIPSGVIYNLKRYPEEQSRLVSASLVLSAGLGFLASLIGIIFIPSWLSQYSIEVIRFAQTLMLLAPVPLLSVVLSATLQAKDEFTVSNQASFFSPLITLVSLVLLALTGTLTPFSSSLVYLLPGIPLCCWMLFRVWKLCSPGLQKLGKSCCQLLSYGIRSYGVEMIGTLSNQVDQALVINFLTPVDMGNYAVALSLSRMLNVFQSSIAQVLFPKASACVLNEVIALVGFAARVSTAVSFLIAIAVIGLGGYLLTLLYGQEFLEAVTVFRILAIEAVLSGTTWLLAQAFMSLGKPGIVTVLQGVGLAISVVLMLVLIPAYGLLGAGLALLISTTLRLLFVLISFPLFLKVRPPSLILKGTDLVSLRNRLQLND